MIPVPSGVRVWLAVGRTDMRRGMNGLALQVQEALRLDPESAYYLPKDRRRGTPTRVQPVSLVLTTGDDGRPLLGICLGLQWMFEGSTEAPELRGRATFPGECKRF